MTRKDSRAWSRARLKTAAGVVLLIAYAGCGFNGVDVPELVGPAEQGTSIALIASPDVIVADGFSTSLITATVRDQNGQPIAGRDIFFAVSDASGNFADVSVYDGRSHADFIITGCLEKLEEVDYEGGVKVEVALSAQMTDIRTGTTVWASSVSDIENVAQRNVPAVVSEMNHSMERTIEKLVSSIPRPAPPSR